MKNLLKYITSSILCLRFPFLYPRNRFTGRHYTNWKLHKFHTDYYKTAVGFLWINVVKESNENQEKHNKTTLGIHDLIISRTSQLVTICTQNLETILYVKPEDYVNSGTLEEAYFENPDKGTVILKFSQDAEIKDDYQHMKTITLDPLLLKIIKIIDWIHDYPLQLLHCIPDHTELDAMETTWRKKFGIKMCKEIRKELLKTGGLKALLNYRIVQIKEKWGQLEWYDAQTTPEIQKIIRKYQQQSTEMCICCGKPSTKKTVDYILYYCDKCAPYYAIDKKED